MGDRLTEEVETEAKSFGDIFDEAFPHYLLMGMTPEQYWDGESGLKKAFRKAYSLKLENEQRIADRNNWYMGQYMMMVLQAVPLLVGGLNVKSTSNLPQYPDKPFFEKFDEQRNTEKRKRMEEDQQKLAMAMFQAFATKVNANIQKRLDREKTSGSDPK